MLSKTTLCVKLMLCCCVVTVVTAVTAVSNEKTDVVQELNTQIKDSLKDNENNKNVIKLLELSLQETNEGEWDGRKERLCDLIQKFDPTLIGLQQVRLAHLSFLQSCFRKSNKACSKIRKHKKTKSSRKTRRSRHIRKCGYEIIGSGSSTGKGPTFFNPVIFKRSRGLRTLGQNGTFWLSETPDESFTRMAGATANRICTWVKLRFGVHMESKKKATSKYNNVLERLLSAIKKSSRERKRTTKWVDFYFVNTQLDTENTEVAKQQLQALLDYLKVNVVKNPEEPVIISGGFDNKDSSEIYKTLIEHDNSFKNAMTDTRTTYGDGSDGGDPTTFVSQKNLVNLLSANLVNGNIIGQIHPQLVALLFENK